jgi:hypothetical protein
MLREAKNHDLPLTLKNGFIRCEACGKSLSGQTQINKHGTQFQYYNHPGGNYWNDSVAKAD